MLRWRPAGTPVAGVPARRYLLVALLPMLLSLWAYRTVPHYSFMYDDPLDLPRAVHHPLIETLTTSGSYSYYRPLSFLIWQGFFAAQGYFDPVVLHALPLLCHAANVCLVARLVYRVAGAAPALAAGTVFAIFPFNYQAVSWAGALFHPLVTLWILVALLAYRRYQHRASWWCLPVSLAAAVLALLTHEYGVTIAPLVCWYDLVWHPGKERTVPPPEGPRAESWRWRPRHRWLLPVLHSALALAYLMMYARIPKEHVAFVLDVASVRLNGLYLLQGVAFWAVRLFAGMQASRDVIVLLAGCLAILLAVVLCLAQSSGRLLLFAAGWVLIAWAPSWLSLSYTYVIDAPRLLYAPSVGVACMWGATVAGVRASRRRSRIAAFVGAACLVALTSQSLGLLREKATLYTIGSHLMEDVTTAAVREADTGGALFVNLVSWIAPPVADFPFGHDGITTVPTYIGLDLAEEVAVGRRVPVAWTGYDVLRAPWYLQYGELGGNSSLKQLDQLMRHRSGVYITRFGETLSLERAGALTEATGYVAPVTGAQARFGQQMVIETVTVEPRPGKRVLHVVWRALARGEGDSTVFVHLYTASGELASATDAYPIAGLSAPRLWHSGDRIEDNHVLDVPGVLAPGTYHIGIGVYDRGTGVRLRATAADDVRLPADTLTVDTFSW